MHTKHGLALVTSKQFYQKGHDIENRGQDVNVRGRAAQRRAREADLDCDAVVDVAAAELIDSAVGFSS